MSTEGYAAFLEQMGHRVRNVGGRYWFDTNPRVYGTFPFDDELQPGHVDVSAVLGRDGLALRYVCPSEMGRQSYVLAVDDKHYDLPMLSAKARNQTRRGLEQCRVEQIEFAALEREGLSLNRDTLLRQGRAEPAGFETYWQRYYAAASTTMGAEAWGAFAGNDLAAYLIAFNTSGCCNILIVRSCREHLKAYPNNALLFGYAFAALRRPDVRRVSIGLEPIQQDMDTLDHFKLGLGFEKKACGQRVDVANWLRPFSKGPMLSVAQRLTGILKRDERVDKLNGLLRWLNEQPKLGRPSI